MNSNGYLLGFDIGSSSVKATLLDIEKGSVLITTSSPKKEMAILAQKPGWAEQDPETWWTHIVNSVQEMKVSGFDLHDVKAVGISYQMHGLVLVNKKLNILRPSIIWCDSRAVSIGAEAFTTIGKDHCLKHMLNSPGNFTASKLAWVKQNEPEIYSQIYKMMLPGDFIGMKMSGEIKTTPSGLSEGILWDFLDQKVSSIVLDNYGISSDLIPETVPTFSVQGELTKEAATVLGLKPGTPISYRAGDQPNNALSLNVLQPGEIAATAGTSGVIYGVGDKPDYDPKSRVNTFVHVNNSSNQPRYGTLLCVNGTGILNSWVKHNIAEHLSYEQINEVASNAPVGSDGVVVLPYGNGAERSLENRSIGALIKNLSFTTHNRSHILRAAQEGIVFALNYGLQIMRDMGMSINTVRAGHANMFLSPIFAQTFATVTGVTVELYSTDGSQGAARGAGIGAGIYKDTREAFSSLKTIKRVEPDLTTQQACTDAYKKWTDVLSSTLEQGD